MGNEPEIRATASGNRIAKLSLATSRKYKGEEQTQWHRLTAFGPVVDVIEKYVSKGDKLYVRGRIEYSQTEHEGQTRYWTDIVIHDMQMLGGGKTEAAPARKQGTGMEAGLPF